MGYGHKAWSCWACLYSQLSSRSAGHDQATHPTTLSWCYLQDEHRYPLTSYLSAPTHTWAYGCRTNLSLYWFTVLQLLCASCWFAPTTSTKCPQVSTSMPPATLRQLMHSKPKLGLFPHLCSYAANWARSHNTSVLGEYWLQHSH